VLINLQQVCHWVITATAMSVFSQRFVVSFLAIVTEFFSGRLIAVVIPVLRGNTANVKPTSEVLPHYSFLSRLYHDFISDDITVTAVLQR
jgi:hypothetical protein